MSIVENLSHPLVSALSWSVVHSIWQFSVILLLFLPVMKLLKGSSAGIRHNVALAALAALPLTFAITFIRQYKIYRHAKMIVSLQFNEEPYTALPGGDSFYLLEKSIPSFFEQVDAFTPYIFWLYLAGFTFFAVGTLLGIFRMNSLRKNSIRPLPSDLMDKINVLSKKSGVSGIHTYLSGKVDIPMVVGMIKPVVLLPVSMMTALEPEQIETIVLHEFRHIRNKDHYINTLQNIVEIFFFFHPATWFISKQLRIERENRIDEWVVGESLAPLPYAQALLQLENNRSRTLQPVLAATQSNKQLITRIKNIMTMKTRSFNPGKNLAALLTILFATFTLAWMDPAHGVGYQDQADHSTQQLHNFPPAVPELLPLSSSATFPDRDQQDAVSPPGEPRKIYFHDGSNMEWEALTEENRQEIIKALEETRLAMQYVNQELLETFNSEEFRQQMNQAREEVKKAREEVNREFESEEFRAQMEAAREEVRKAMEEVPREFESEEFREEIKKAGREVVEAMTELEEVDWEAIGEEINRAMMEAGKAVEEVGPIVNEAIRELKLDELLKEILEVLEKATSPEEGEDSSHEEDERPSVQEGENASHEEKSEEPGE